MANMVVLNGYGAPEICEQIIYQRCNLSLLYNIATMRSSQLYYIEPIPAGSSFTTRLIVGFATWNSSPIALLDFLGFGS